MIERVIATDFCCFENLDQQLSKQGLVYIRGDHRDSAAANSNGAGKSTLYKAVTWCLYGRTVDEDEWGSPDDAIRRGAKEATVTVILADGDMIWYVNRTRRKGKPGLAIQFVTGDEPGVFHEIKGAKEQLQDKIVELIGLDFRAFKNTVLYGQNDSFKFADARTKDSARKDMLHRILRTETLQACHEVAKERYKQQRNEMEKVQNALHSIDSKMEMIDLSEVERRRDKWNAERSGRVDQRKEMVKRYKQKAENLLRDAPDVSAMDERLEGMRTSYAAARDVGRGFVIAQEAVGKIREQISEHEVKADKADNELDQLSKQAKRLKGSVCPVCTAPLTSGKPHKHKVSIEKQLAAAQAIYERESSDAENLQPKFDDAKAKAKECMDANNKASDIRDDADDLKEEIEAAKGVKNEAQEYIEKAKVEVTEAKRLRTEENPHDEAIGVAKSKVKTLKDEAKGLKKRRETLAENMAYTQFWVRGYSPQGLPSFVLDAVMPFLTDRTNEYLETLADGDITMCISTQRELKSQKDAVRDEIDIQWIIEGNEGVAKSGGQRTRMSLAMDLALMDLAATREGINLDLLMIDEALDGMDKEGTARVLVLLKQIRKRRGSIFVISHSDDMSDSFTSGLCVIREDGVSRIVKE